MLRRTDVIMLTLLVLSVNGLFGCTDKKSVETKSTKKSSKKDNQKKQPDSQSRAAELDQKERDAANAVKINRAKSQIKSLRYALEAYNTDVGFYPSDPKDRIGADIPDFMFIGLNNKPTVALGGGPNSPYIDKPEFSIGLTKEDGEAQLLDPSGAPSAMQFQKDHPPRSADEVGDMDDLKNPRLKGTLLYLDPWNNPYHYREWNSKSEKLKAQFTEKGQAKTTIHNANSFDIWSNGPDGVNNYGAKGSDDIKNWND